MKEESGIRNRTANHIVPSLERLAVTTIVTNIWQYKGLLKRIVAPPLHSVLFDALFENKRDQLKDQLNSNFQHLILPHKIDTSIFHSLCPRSELWQIHAEKILRCLATAAPKLRDLSVASYHTVGIEMQSLTNDSISCVRQMRNLVHLRIDAIIKFEDLMNICMECEKLQSVRVAAVVIDCSIPDIFERHLQFIDGMFNRQEYEEISAGSFFVRLERKIPERIRQCSCTLIVDTDRTRSLLPKVANLTELKIFIVLQKSYRARLIVDKFDTETARQLAKSPSLSIRPKEIPTKSEVQENVFSILREAKGNIKSLSLILGNEATKPDISFQEIFGLFKNLEVLKVERMCLNDDGGPLPFGPLRVLSWENSYSKFSLSNRILSAPFLRYVTIKSNYFDLTDKDAFLERVAKREILKDIRRFDIFPGNDPRAEQFREFASALQSAIPGSRVKIII